MVHGERFKELKLLPAAAQLQTADNEIGESITT
jgi:hypothetical protein